jgi:hypothetical protein
MKAFYILSVALSLMLAAGRINARSYGSSSDGDVLALRLYGTTGTAGAKLAAASGGATVELTFEGDAPHRNSLGGRTDAGAGRPPAPVAAP